MRVLQWECGAEGECMNPGAGRLVPAGVDEAELAARVGADTDVVLIPQARYRPGPAGVTVMVVEGCRSVLMERCRKIAT